MPRPGEPEIKDLSKKEILDILRRNSVGRMAFSFRDRVDIRPVHFVWRKGWLFGRTSPGDKMSKLGPNRWVAFEVDEIDGPLDWRSVIVHGTFYRLSPEGSVYDRRLYTRALRAIRELAPSTLTEDDPVAYRSEIFGISIESATGRSSSTARNRARKRAS